MLKQKSNLWARLSRFFAVAIVMMGMLIGPLTPSAHAGINDGDNYPHLWKVGGLGQYTDSWGYASRYCTSWVAFALSDRNGFTMPHAIGDASAWGSVAAGMGYAVNMTPAVGAVAWWSSNHVAWVKSVNANNTVTIEEYNYAGSGYNVRTIATNSVSGYIHFNDISTQWQWHLRNENSAGGAFTSFNYGSITLGDHPIVGDWDGNGTVTPGIVRNVGGQWQWHLRSDNSAGGAYVSFNYGAATDNPIVGDWDGNGTDTPGITRVVGGDLQWHLRNENSAGGAFTSFNYGASTDGPVYGDWDGNGTTTPGIVRNVGGQWYWHLRHENSAGGAYTSFSFGGAPTDRPIFGDWDGNGTVTPGIARNVGGQWQWHLRNENSTGGAFTSFNYGLASDIPLVGDWDGNGTATPVIVRAAN